MSFQAAVESLTSHEEAKANVRRMCRTLEEDIMRYVESKGSRQRFEDLSIARHQRFVQETDRVSQKLLISPLLDPNLYSSPTYAG